MRPIRFTCRRPRSQRVHHVTEADVRIVLERLPAPLSKRLKAVHFDDGAMGRRIAGYVCQVRDEIALCALPRRVSMARFLRRSQSPAQFGAVRGCQWPGLAVRRFMLYDVFLHELGHLQVIRPRAKSSRRKFADETLAQQFAEHWCRELWSRPFDHPDPVHNPPPPEELEALRSGWRAAHGDYKMGMIAEKLKQFEVAVHLLSKALEQFSRHPHALERLGALTWAGKGTTQSSTAAIELLGKAVQADPTLPDAHLFLALALSGERRESEARCSFRQAIQLDEHPPVAMSEYADCLANWGYHAEAESVFRAALKRNDRCALAIRDYGRCLMREHDPPEDQNIARAVTLFERAVALSPRDAESHYCLGVTLFYLEGEEVRAVFHLETALKLNPNHTRAAECLAAYESNAMDAASMEVESGRSPPGADGPAT